MTDIVPELKWTVLGGGKNRWFRTVQQVLWWREVQGALREGGGGWQEGEEGADLRRLHGDRVLK